MPQPSLFRNNESRIETFKKFLSATSSLTNRHAAIKCLGNDDIPSPTRITFLAGNFKFKMAACLLPGPERIPAL
jgi:hypothetical protein